MDFRLLHRKDLLVSYLAAIYPSDKQKFRRWTVKRLKAAVYNIAKRRGL
jgi:hypothetical protein